MLARLRELVPESPFHYPADDASTADLRFIVAEVIHHHQQHADSIAD